MTILAGLDINARPCLYEFTPESEPPYRELGHAEWCQILIGIGAVPGELLLVGFERFSRQDVGRWYRRDGGKR